MTCSINYIQPVAYWRNSETRRGWFVEFAEENNFDPYVPSNWYNITSQQLQNKKVYSIHYYFQLLIASYEGGRGGTQVSFGVTFESSFGFVS